jgi:gamma-glutamyltranspeptidase/glutathione hydrolase
MPTALRSQRPAVRGVTHMAASGHYLATAAAYRILEDGGNAIDAGVAAGIVLGVTLPQWVTFGGVAPVMVYSAESGEVSTVSGLGRWPQSATLEAVTDRASGGPPAPIERIVTPAAPDAWLTTLERFGTMPFEEIVAPAREICRDGFVIQGTVAHLLPTMGPMMDGSPGLSDLLAPGGQLLSEGDRLEQPQLAATFDRLIDAERAASAGGRTVAIRAARDEFYRGDIAREIAAFVAERDGFLDYDDLAGFTVGVEPPLTGRFGDLTVNVCGPWCQGPALIEVLQILEGFDLAALGHNSADYVHTLVEAIKLAFSDRHYYFGDPDFVRVPIEGLTSLSFAAERREQIDAARAHPGMPAPGDPFAHQSDPQGDWELASEPQSTLAPVEQDTSYVCVVDRWGNGFSATPSDAYQNFIPELGFGISSRGSQSWLDPDHPSVLAPGKRPRLTPNPAMAFKDGRLYLTLGTPGLDVQVQAMTQLLANIEVFGLDPQEAIEAPRFASFSFPLTGMFGRYEPGVLRCESGVGTDTIAELSSRGHIVEDWGERNYLAGGLCAIQVDHDRGTLTAGADFRRDAYAMGR